MGRKVFQISFILLVIAAFGTVFNHYLKNKTSNPVDYLGYIESYPVKPISIIDPIVIKLPRDFDKQEYQLNTPLKSSIMQFTPDVEGTLYWSDAKTLEFYPDEPLQSSAEYMVKVDLNRIYKLKSKLKQFSFRLQTFKQVLYVSSSGYKSLDSSLVSQNLEGNIVFSDFMDIDDVYRLFSATQGSKKLNISFTPGQSKGAYYFNIEGVKRKQKTDSVKMLWDGNSFDMDLQGHKYFTVPAINNFSINKIDLINIDSLVLNILFSDELLADQKFINLIDVKGAKIKSFEVGGKILKIGLDSLRTDKVLITLNKDLTNQIGVKLVDNYSNLITLDKNEPALRIIDSLNVFSEISEQFYWEFEAKMLKAVDVQVYKIFPNNVLQFLQTNTLKSINQLERVGSIIYQNTISLTDQLQYNPEQWNKYQLNINNVVPEEGCIYSVLIGFRKEHAVIDCNLNNSDTENNWEQFTQPYYSPLISDTINSPCQESFYGFRKGIHHNLYFTHLGIISKSIGADSLYIWVNDLKSGEPVKNVSIEILNYQQQIIAKSISNNLGMARFKMSAPASFVIARQGDVSTYLRLSEDNYNVNTVGLNREDDKNFKGYFILSRDYWSPGDTLNVGFIHNEKKDLDLGSIVELNIVDPDKKKIYSEIQPVNKTNIYSFNYKISPGVLNGRYELVINLDGKKFRRGINILPPIADYIEPIIELVETTDNAYKYKLYVSDFIKQAGDITFSINSKSVFYTSSLSRYRKFEFPLNIQETETVEMRGSLDKNNEFIFKIPKQTSANGFGVIHEIDALVLSQGIGFNQSVYKDTIKFSNPKLGVAVENEQLYYCDSAYALSFLLLDGNNKIIRGKHKVDVVVSRLSPKGKAIELKHDEVIAVNGKADYSFFVPFPERGLYRITAQVRQKNLKIEKDINVYWPAQFDDFENLEASELNIIKDVKLSSDDSLSITISSTKLGKCLLMVETPLAMNSMKWVDLQVHDTTFLVHVKNKNELKYNVYAYLHSEQSKPNLSKYKFVNTLLPMALSPVIYSGHETSAENKFSFKVKEENGLPMNYIVQVRPSDKQHVDSVSFFDRFFETDFYGTNSLSDLFGNFESDFPESIKKSWPTNYTYTSLAPFRNFDMLLGPYRLNADIGKDHSIRIPQFIGDIDIMVYAVSDDLQNFGVVKHNITVNEPLMILTTVPDHIAPNEVFYLPVNVYSSKAGKRKAKISLSDYSEIEILDSISKQIEVNQLSTNYKDFKLKAKKRTGKGELDIVANDSAYKTKTSIEVPISTNGMFTTNTQQFQLSPDLTWEGRFKPLGVKGSNLASIEYSVYDNIHLRLLLQRLLTNKHSDIEHLISSALPLLFIDDLTNVSIEFQEVLNKHVREVINRLIYYQLPSGGFSYWMDSEQIHPWVSSFAGYFMLRALEQGFVINQAVYNKWLRYQRKSCLTYNYLKEGDDVIQAFGLYILAMAGKPDMKSLVKLTEKNISDEAKLLIQMSQNEFDRREVFDFNIDNRGALAYLNNPTFSSDLRKQAFILNTILNNDDETIINQMSKVSSYLKSSDKLSLQSIAFALVSITDAISRLESINEKSLKYSLNRGKEKSHTSTKPYGIVDLPLEFTLTKTIDITNNCKHQLNVCIDNIGQPHVYNSNSFTKNIKSKVHYYNMNDELLTKNILKVNDQVRVEVKIESFANELDVKNMVLVYPVANCFQILGSSIIDRKYIENISISDQNVYVYFTLPKEGLNLSLSLLSTYQGEFNQPPVEIYNLYNPVYKTVLKGQRFVVN